MDLDGIIPEKGMICTINGISPVIVRSISKDKKSMMVQKLVVCDVRRSGALKQSLDPNGESSDGTKSNDKPNGTIVYDKPSYSDELKYKDVKLSSSDYEIVKWYNDVYKRDYEYAICKDVGYDKRKRFIYYEARKDMTLDELGRRVNPDARALLKENNTRKFYYRRDKILQFHNESFNSSHINLKYFHDKMDDHTLPVIYINDN